jgi:hypothetical protein
MGPPNGDRISSDETTEALKNAGFTIAETKEISEMHYFVTARV